MRLIFHVFQKDLRRLAAPLFVLLALMATGAIGEIQRYRSHPPVLRHELQAIPILLPFAWIFLIAAVVVQERLPGTTQYWLTRPIAWPKLLAAKLLFVLVFINCIWFLSDCFILSSLHLSIDVADLWLRQIPLSFILFLPAFCLASVSKGLGQIALGLLMAALAFVADVLFTTFVFSGHTGGFMSFNVVDRFQAVPLGAAAAIVIVIILLQFARRATFASRLLLVPVFLLIPVALLAVVSLSYQQKQRSVRPEVEEGSPNVRISFDFKSGRRQPSVQNGRFTILTLPLRIDGLPPKTYVEGSGNVNLPLPPPFNHPGASVINDSGYWLRMELRDEDLPQLSKGNVTIDAFVGISEFTIEKTESIKFGGNQTVSPAPDTFCRSISTMEAPVFCWSGPSQTSSLEFRAFIGTVKSPTQLAPEPRARAWSFSPVVSWVLSSPFRSSSPPRSDPNAIVRFITIRASDQVSRKLPAETVDLKQYMVKE